MQLVSFLGKCSEPRPRGVCYSATSLATPPTTGAGSIFKNFPRKLWLLVSPWATLPCLPTSQTGLDFLNYPLSDAGSSTLSESLTVPDNTTAN
jgi:hypothetical protein